jgi:hypothetical protein
MSQAPQHSTAHHSPQAAHRGTASSPKSHVTKCESGRSVSPKPHSPRISTEEYLRIKDKIRRAADVGADELKKIPSADLKRFYRNAVACRNRDSVNPKKTEIIAYIINNKTEVFENDYKSKREAAAAEGKRAEAMKLNQEELNRYYNEFEKRNFSAAARLPKYQLNQLLFSVGMRNYSTVKKDELPQWVRENWLPRHPPHYSEKVRSPDTSKAREAAKLARDLRLRGQTYQKATIMKQTSPSSRREPKSKYGGDLPAAEKEEQELPQRRPHQLPGGERAAHPREDAQPPAPEAGQGICGSQPGTFGRPLWLQLLIIL